MKSTFCFITLACLAVAHGQSVKSCGGPNDHLQNASFTVSPDPIDKHKPLTITAMGTLDEAYTGGTIDIDLNIKALGVISTDVKKSGPVTVGPGLAVGPQKVVIGPFTLPSIPLGLSVDVAGQISGKDTKGEPVFCVALNLNVLNEVAPLAAATEVAAPAAGPISDCGSASDHLKNKTTSSSGGTVKFSGDLDESVASGEVDVDVEVKVTFIKIPIKTNVPFSISPAIPAGAITASAGPFADTSTSTSEVASPDIKVEVSGNVKINDGQKEEIACIAIDVNP